MWNKKLREGLGTYMVVLLMAGCTTRYTESTPEQIATACMEALEHFDVEAARELMTDSDENFQMLQRMEHAAAAMDAGQMKRYHEQFKERKHAYKVETPAPDRAVVTVTAVGAPGPSFVFYIIKSNNGWEIERLVPGV